MVRMNPIGQARFGYPHMRGRAEDWIESVISGYVMKLFYVKINGSEFLARKVNDDLWVWCEEPHWFEYDVIDMEIIPLSDFDPAELEPFE